MKGLHFVFTWTTFLILFEPYHDTTESCFHDKLHQGNMVENVTQLWQLGNRNQSQRKQKRSVQDAYSPIRITTIYSLDEYLLAEEQDALKRVLERAVRKITGLLSVMSVDGPLLLARDACPVILRKGINKGRCLRIQKGYSGEYCLDNFKIPSSHLEGFATYNKTHPDPVHTYFEDGPGLKDTDFVLYVTSLTTHLCNPYKSSALAYASYCQLDSTGRPIAGQVNFCPRNVKSQKFDEELMYKTAVHELFHAFGFSYKLFDKYRTCNEDGICELWPRPMTKPSDGRMRLGTSAVIREMRRHFNCSAERDFGGPLELMNGRVTSHWDPTLMYSSIMGSKEQKPYLTLIDPISLAVFEDTGWYKVNYSQADTFLWGQGQGCSFGLSGSCNTQDGFCTKNITGCHHLRLTKARCNINTNSSTSACGIFAADQRPCFLSPVNSSSSPDEIFSSSSRCFLSSLVPAHSHQGEKEHHMTEVTGRCYERKCEDDQVYVRVQGGDWTYCQPGSYVQVQGFEGSIECPRYAELCTDFIYPEPVVSVQTTESTTYVSEITSTQSSTQGMTTRGQGCSSGVCMDVVRETNSAVLVLKPLTAIIGVVAAVSEYLFS